MITTYLFDWGDTLMIDFPHAQGKMCDWKTVQTVSGAKETLAHLSQNATIYVATNAMDSSEADIKSAFARVHLSQYISGYFCQQNVGFSKGNAKFLDVILKKLNQPLANIAMVGDNVEKDIKPALAAGINAIWLTQNNDKIIEGNVRVINSLRTLCQ